MISVNLIPSNLWFLNLRKLLSPQQWINLSNKIRSEQQWTCQFCSISIKELKSSKWFDCHEQWKFNDQTKQVELYCLLCLCKKCHTSTHFGLACVQNRNKIAFDHICKINKWNAQTTSLYLEACFEKWTLQSTKKWTLDLTSVQKLVDQDIFSTIEKNYKELVQ